jgi:hypothetical protein
VQHGIDVRGSEPRRHGSTKLRGTQDLTAASAANLAQFHRELLGVTGGTGAGATE